MYVCIYIGPCPPYCRDYAAAYYHLDQAASRGDADALLFLGLMIKAGEYVAPDCDKSCSAFKQCAERGPWSHLLQQAFMAWNAGDKVRVHVGVPACGGVGVCLPGPCSVPASRLHLRCLCWPLGASAVPSVSLMRGRGRAGGGLPAVPHRG